MRIASLVVLGFFYFLFSCQDTVQKNKDAHQANLQEIPSNYFFQQRAYPYGKIDQASYRRARSSQKQVQVRTGNAAYEQAWQLRGPSNIGGRITDLEMPPQDQQTIYAGSASGGIFKSIDQGAHFEPIFDEAGSLSIGDLDLYVKNPDIIYVGTGEANAGGGSLAYDGDGVYKSMDAGLSWTSAGLKDAGSIGKVQISRQDSNIVYVAAMGHLFSNSGQRGIYKTVDGGQNWEQVLFLSDSTGGIDLAIHPENDDIIYAAMWERVRRPHNRQYGGATSGIYRSIDGGASWVELSNGLPTAPDQKGRIGLGLAPSQPDLIYAYYVDAIGEVQGIYRTEDGGDNWQSRSIRNLSSVSFGWWFGKIVVHPQDPNIIYLTNLNMHRSIDGGLNWNNTFSGVHVDQHALFIHPANPDLVLNGNDGGIYISQNRGNTYKKVDDLANIQFYACKIDPNNPDRLYGGMQDNGTNRTTTGSVDDWRFLRGGDGFGINVDPSNSNIFYAQAQRGVLFRTEDDGQNFTNITFGTNFNWNTPLKMDPINPNILYCGNQRLYRSLDRGDTWEAISESLVNAQNPSGNLTFGTLTTIDISPLDQQVIYVGTDDGNVWLSKNGGNSWTSISQAIPQRWITRVVASPYDPATVYLTVSGFRFGESEAQVFRSDNYGFNWTAIGQGLPDIPVNDLIPDPSQTGVLYLASDIGVYYSLDDGNTWQVLGTDLPSVPVTDIDLHVESGTLAAATYGRSMYSYPLPLISNTQEQSIPSMISLYPNPSNGQFSIQTASGEVLLKQIQVFNLSGKMVAYEIGKGLSSQRLNIDLPSGTYLLKATTVKNRVLSQQLIIL